MTKLVFLFIFFTSIDKTYGFIYNVSGYKISYGQVR